VNTRHPIIATRLRHARPRGGATAATCTDAATLRLCAADGGSWGGVGPCAEPGPCATVACVEGEGCRASVLVEGAFCGDGKVCRGGRGGGPTG
jgi:hypothetical protein